MPSAQNAAKRGPGRPKNSVTPPVAAAAQLAVQPESNYGADTLDVAKDLARFIKENKLSTQMQGKEFVNVEGWQYAGSRLGIVPIVETVQDRSTAEEIKYEAKVTLFSLSGKCTVGAGFAICSNKESGKKFNQEFAIASMAQTRAIGKAYRNILAWIIRAAGYEPTPAEELDYAGNVPTPAAAAPAAAPAPAPAPVAAARPAVSPNGATARITTPVPAAEPAPKLKAPTLLTPEPTPAAAPAAQPTMQVNRQPATSAAAAVAGRTAALQAAGVVLSTGLQHQLIGLLLQCPAVTNSQRTATLLNYLRFTHERAQTSIGRLIKVAEDAGAPLPENLGQLQADIAAEYEQLLVPGSRAAAAAQLRFLANTNLEKLGKVEVGRLLAICENPTYTAQQLVEEHDHGSIYLADMVA